MARDLGPYTMAGFGDSITQGAGASRPEYGWLAVLESRMRPFLNRPLNVINASVGDNTISPRTTNYKEASHPSALERLSKDVLSRKPDLVLVCYGLNDMRFGTPADVFAEDLGEILAQLRNALPSGQFLLTNVFHMTGWDRYEPRNKGSRDLTRAYNQAIDRVAVRHHAMLADVWSAMGERDFLIAPDGVHANDLGHAVIAGRVFETLVKGLPVFRGNVVNQARP